MPLLLTQVGENMGHYGHAGPAGECRGYAVGERTGFFVDWEKLPLFLLPTVNREEDGVHCC